MRLRYLVMGIVGVLALALYVGLTSEDDAVATPTRTRAPAVVSDKRDVTYRVTTSANNHDVSLTYENASGNTEQMDTTVHDRLWMRELRIDAGAFAYVAVQNREDGGRVRCEILVDGVVVEQAESEGAYVIATCSGSVR